MINARIKDEPIYDYKTFDATSLQNSDVFSKLETLLQTHKRFALILE